MADIFFQMEKALQAEINKAWEAVLDLNKMENNVFESWTGQEEQ